MKELGRTSSTGEKVYVVAVEPAGAFDGSDDSDDFDDFDGSDDFPATGQWSVWTTLEAARFERSRILHERDLNGETGDTPQIWVETTSRKRVE